MRKLPIRMLRTQLTPLATLAEVAGHQSQEGQTTSPLKTATTDLCNHQPVQWPCPFVTSIGGQGGEVLASTYPTLMQGYKMNCDPNQCLHTKPRVRDQNKPILDVTHVPESNVLISTTHMHIGFL